MKNKKIRNPWYADLIPGTPLPASERTVFAVRGVLPQFRGILLTLRIIHLFSFQNHTGRGPNQMEWREQKPKLEPEPWHFPGVENSSHHLFLHTRLTNKTPVSWEEMSSVDTTLSMQFVVQGDFDWLKIGPILPGYYPPDQSLFPISQEERAANLLAGQIGFYLADRWMPTIQEQWLVERYLDPTSRKKGNKLKLLPEEKKAERLRIADWTGRMDYCYSKLTERYQNILERTPEHLSRGSE